MSRHPWCRSKPRRGNRRRRDLVLPARDTLFTSGTLGRYSKMLHSVMESQTTEPAETAAD